MASPHLALSLLDKKWGRTPVRKQKINANKGQPHHAPLPDGWECRIDPLDRTYRVDRNTRSTTWNSPSLNQVVDHQAQEGDTTTADSGSVPAGWGE